MQAFRLTVWFGVFNLKNCFGLVRPWFELDKQRISLLWMLAKIPIKDCLHHCKSRVWYHRQIFHTVQARTGSKKAQVTQYRDKLTGKLLTKEEMEESQRKAKEKNRPKFETPEWGGGLRQVNFLTYHSFLYFTIKISKTLTWCSIMCRFEKNLIPDYM